MAAAVKAAVAAAKKEGAVARRKSAVRLKVRLLQRLQPEGDAPQI